MRNGSEAKVAIIDYGMGNLFSVQRACEHVGISATITNSHREICAADALILPGVGAFGTAMENLRRLDLIKAIKDGADSRKPIMGICLGMQLLMSESCEFGHHAGLNLISGSVVPLVHHRGQDGMLKIPQVCWNQLKQVPRERNVWKGSFLERLPDGVYMYFNHSFCVVPKDTSCIIATTVYGSIEFCSAIQVGNLFACQCHPERSGQLGLAVYRNLAARLAN